MNSDLKIKTPVTKESARYCNFIFSDPGSAPYEFYHSREREIMAEGPADTGKSVTACLKTLAIGFEHPGTRILYIRKTRESIKNSVVPTFNGILPYDPLERGNEIELLGGSNPTGYRFQNGSSIVFGGTNHIEEYLSSYWHIVYVNQAEEISEEHWSLLMSRCTHRAEHPTLPFRQIIGDCNPADSNHWILTRDRLNRYKIRHEDNPSIMQNGEYVNDEARSRIEDLKSLPSPLLERYYLGEWFSSEDVVYREFSKKKHVKPLRIGDIPRDWHCAGAIDYGLKDASVYWIYFYSPDRENVRFMYELYRTGLNANELAEEIHKMHKELDVKPRYIVSDHDLNSRDILEKTGLPIEPADKNSKNGGLITGIDNAKKWFKKDHESLLINEFSLNFVDPELEKRKLPTSTVQELGIYSYYPIDEQAKRKNPDEPIDKHNHGCDTLRYALWKLSSPRTYYRGVYGKARANNNTPSYLR